MSAKLKQVIESIGELSSNERALIAHCLISSLENAPEDGVDDAWAELAESRYAELQSGVAEGATWQEIKSAAKA